MTGSLLLSDVDWLPDPESFEPDSETRKLVTRLKMILEDAEVPAGADGANCMAPLSSEDGSKVSRVLQALSVRLGDKIVVGGVKVSLMDHVC